MLLSLVFQKSSFTISKLTLNTSTYFSHSMQSAIRFILHHIHVVLTHQYKGGYGIFLDNLNHIQQQIH